MPKRKPKTSWGGVAGWYDKLLEGSGDTYQSKVILPNLVRLVDPRPNELILDIACGQGMFSRAFTNSKAKVVGTDISGELIALAKKKALPNAEFRVAPAHAMPFVQSASVDKAVIVLAIQNIENFAEVFAECRRVLKPSGHLSLVMNHPAFRIPGRTSWEWDEAMKTQYRRVNAYLSDSRAAIDMHPSATRENSDATRGKQTISFHRPLQVYMKALAKNGFAVVKLEEWISHKKSEPGPRAREEDRIRKEIPLFLYIEARQLSEL
jgi:ubiquinone/menaquinone biosynthesis C-methylase UbiE